MQTNLSKRRVSLYESPIGSSVPYMKKMLVYYPKSPSILNRLTRSKLNVTSNEGSQVRRLYQRVLSKYSKSSIHNHHVDAVSKRCHTEILCDKMTSLCIEGANINRNMLEKSIQQNKKLKTLKISWNDFYYAELMSCLRYTPTLQTLEIHNLPYLSEKEFRRALSASKNTLKSVSIIRIDHRKYQAEEEKLVEYVKTIQQLPHLRKFFVDIPDCTAFALDMFPMQKLKEISFDLRFKQADLKDLLSQTARKTCFQNVDYLEINDLYDFYFKDQTSCQWNLISQEKSETKSRSQRRMFFDNVCFSNLDSMNLLDSFVNIITLDVNINGNINSTIDRFCAPLGNLCKLENLFIQFNGFKKKYIIDNLCSSTRKFKTLKLVSITLSFCVLDDSCEIFDEFFRACADCVTKVILKFDRCYDTSGQGFKHFYEGLPQLKQIRSLNILYEPNRDEIVNNHFPLLKKALESIQNLNELKLLSIRNNNQIQKEKITGILENLKDLHKLTLSLLDVSVKQKLLQEMRTLTNLRHIEVTVSVLNETTWAQIQKIIIINLKKLETLKILCKFYSEALKKKLDALIKSHAALKFIAVKYPKGWILKEYEVLVLRKEKYWTDIDNFFWNNCDGLPQKSNPEIYSY